MSLERTLLLFDERSPGEITVPHKNTNHGKATDTDLDYDHNANVNPNGKGYTST